MSIFTYTYMYVYIYIYIYTTIDVWACHGMSENGRLSLMLQSPGLIVRKAQDTQGQVLSSLGKSMGKSHRKSKNHL